MSVSINGTTGLTFADATTQTTSAFYGGLAMRNRLINGAMVIDQRNAGASVTPINSYTVDRWWVLASLSGKLTAQQNAANITRPAGFSSYLGLTSTSAYSVLTGDYFTLVQGIEGNNVSDLGWGTANAATITISFKVYSSLTGTFGGTLQNAGQTRSYPFTYSVPVANTWTTVSVTIPGDTAGTWLTNNGAGIYVMFALGVGATYSGTAGAWAAGNLFSATGAVSVVGTSGATFYITGVQLEKGSTATSFDYRPYGTELQLCQRYLPAFNATSATCPVGPAFTAGATQAILPFVHNVTPRVPPTGVTTTNATYFTFGSVAGYAASGVGISLAGTTCTTLSFTIATAPTGVGGYLYATNAAAQLLFTGCEL